MSVMWLVLPLAIVFAAIAVGAFIWAVRSGQLDDLDTPAVRPLVDDLEGEPPASPASDDGERNRSAPPAAQAGPSATEVRAGEGGA